MLRSLAPTAAASSSRGLLAAHAPARHPCALAIPRASQFILPLAAEHAGAAVSPLGGVRWANSKGGGSTLNGRDSKPKYLGVKKFGSEFVEPGNIIIRQRGAKYGIVESTATVAFGTDWTIYALKPGYVKFWWHPMRKKNFIEVIKTPHWEMAARGGVIQKYPIVKVPDWELPWLLKLPLTSNVDEAVLDRLRAYVASLNPTERYTIVPRGVELLGGVHEIAYPGQAIRAGGGHTGADNGLLGGSGMGASAGARPRSGEFSAETAMP